MYERIKTLREEHRLYQKQVAQELNCSQQVYSDYENGHVDIPTQVLIRLAKRYGTTTDYLLGLSDLRTPAATVAHTDRASCLVERFRALGQREQLALLKLSEFFLEVQGVRHD